MCAILDLGVSLAGKLVFLGPLERLHNNWLCYKLISLKVTCLFSEYPKLLCSAASSYIKGGCLEAQLFWNEIDYYGGKRENLQKRF